jgi:hypothetical protein
LTDSSSDEADVRDIAALLALGIGYRVDLFATLWVQDLKNGQFVVQQQDVVTQKNFDPTLFADAREAARHFVAERRRIALGLDFEGGEVSTREGAPREAESTEALTIARLLERQVGYGVDWDSLYVRGLEDGTHAVGSADGADELIFEDPEIAVKTFLARLREPMGQTGPR